VKWAGIAALPLVAMALDLDIEVWELLTWGGITLLTAWWERDAKRYTARLSAWAKVEAARYGASDDDDD